MQVDGSVAVVVGGASGMARATAEELARAGARIAVLDLPQSEGKKVAGEIGNGTVFCPVDACTCLSGRLSYACSRPE